MIATCANPNCVAGLRYLRRGGRLIAVDTEDTDWATGRPHQQRLIFCQCESCASSFDTAILNGTPGYRATKHVHDER